MRHTLATALALASLATVTRPATAQLRTNSRDAVFQWSGELASGQRLHLYNINGPLTVESTTGRKVEVSARESWRRGDPRDVTFVSKRVNNDRDVVVCALWRNQQEDCDENGYKMIRVRRGLQNNDVQVEFTVKLPVGAHVTAHTVNGDVEVTGVSGDIDAETVNGNVDAESRDGAVAASTVNGDIHVRMARVPRNGAKYETVNGSVSVAFPAGADLDLLASTVTGSVSSDFPITMTGSMSTHRLRGTIGRGGPRVEISTVNGRVRITRQ